MIKVCLCVVIMILTFYIMGALFVEVKRGAAALVMGGFLTQLAVFSVVSLPCIFFGTSMRFYGRLMSSVVIALCVVAILREKQNLFKPAAEAIGRILS